MAYLNSEINWVKLIKEYYDDKMYKRDNTLNGNLENASSAKEIEQIVAF